jgi:hypothetical protein
MLRLVQLLVLSVPVLCGGAASTQHSIVEHGNHEFECRAVFAVMRQLNYVPRTKVVHRAVDIDSFTGDCCALNEVQCGRDITKRVEGIYITSPESDAKSDKYFIAFPQEILRLKWLKYLYFKVIQASQRVCVC